MSLAVAEVSQHLLSWRVVSSCGVSDRSSSPSVLCLCQGVAYRTLFCGLGSTSNGSFASHGGQVNNYISVVASNSTWREFSYV
jgi:hypothetical protein